MLPMLILPSGFFEGESMNFRGQQLTDAFFSATYLFCTRKYLARRLASIMCVRDSWEIDEQMPQIKRLIRARPDLSGKDGQYVLGVSRDHPELFRAFLDAGVAHDEKNDEGRTLLTITGISGTPEVAHMLIEKGAIIDNPDKWGKTALMYAVAARPDMVDLLLSQGASLHMRDARGLTAVDYALSPPEHSGLVEVHEKCRQLVIAAKEKEDGEKFAYDAYLADGLPAMSPIVIRKPLSLIRRNYAGF